MAEEKNDATATEVHPTALVADGVVLGEGTVIGPGAVLESAVEIGRNCRVSAYAIIRSGTVLGDRVEVDSFSVIGGLPQDLHFDRDMRSGVRVGEGTVFRESVTVSRSTRENGMTEIGRDCFFMACSHVAHDCRVGDQAVLANGVLLAGHVSLGAYSFLGGGTGVHQFGRIGESVMVSGNASISMDIPPYLMAAERNESIGVNLIGLRRRGFSRDVLRELKAVYRDVYGGRNLVTRAAEVLESGRYRTEEAKNFLSFFKDGKRGFVRSRRAVAATTPNE